MKKRSYRRISFKTLSAQTVIEQLEGRRRLVLAIDVGKTDMVAAVVDPGAEPERRVLHTVGFKYPAEHASLREFVTVLVTAGVAIEAVMEPSGNYGDALRYQLQRLAVPVYRVSTHRTHRSAEAYDGVASLHDAKSAHILSKLHCDGASRLWSQAQEPTRVLGAAIAILDLHRQQRQRQIGRLEALLARHWPELLAVMKLGSATQLSLLSNIGGPEQVAARPDQTAQLLKIASQGMLKPAVIDAVLESAQRSIGMPLCAAELELLQVLSADALQTLERYQHAAARVRKLGRRTDAVLLSALVGDVTAALLVHDVGSPRAFGSARAYLKAYGLNLREKSSGLHKGKLKLTKRGPSRARRYLCLAALRLMQSDPYARAYYAAKVARDGGVKMRAVVALMRKLAKALYAMAHSQAPFDSTKLFDVSRLSLRAT